MEEEINLRELIEVLLRGKWVIAGITALAVLAAGLISFFVLEEKYEASSTIMANNLPQNTEEPENSNLGELLDSITEYPEMTLETFRDQVKNPRLLQQTIDQLDLDPNQYSVHSLSDKVTAEVVEETNLIRIKVTDRDPQKAARIANNLADNFVAFITDKSKQRLSDSVQFIDEQLKEQQEEMAGAVEEYKDFLAQPNGVEELQNEFQTKLSLLTSFKKQRVQNEVQLQKMQSSLQQVKEDIAATPQKLVTEKSLAEDSYLFDVTGSATGQSVEELSGLKMDSEQINPVYTNLVNRKVQLQEDLAATRQEQEQLQDKIASLGSEVEQLQARLAEKRVTEERLSSRVDMLRSNYEMLTRKYQETRVSSSAEIGEASIMVLSDAARPEVPVAPNKKLNVAVAFVLGLMLSVFIVFFREFWRNSAPGDNTGVQE